MFYENIEMFPIQAFFNFFFFFFWYSDVLIMTGQGFHLIPHLMINLLQKKPRKLWHYIAAKLL